MDVAGAVATKALRGTIVVLNVTAHALARMQEARAAAAPEQKELRSDAYIEITLAVIVTLVTTLAMIKVVPHVASAAAFFVKFCISAAIFNLTVQLIKSSVVYQTIAALIGA